MEKTLSRLKKRVLVPFMRAAGMTDQQIAAIRLPRWVRRTMRGKGPWIRWLSKWRQPVVVKVPVIPATEFVIDAITEGLSAEDAHRWCERMVELHPHRAAEIANAQLAGFWRLAPEQTLRAADALVGEIPNGDVRKLRRIANYFIKTGRINKSIEVLSRVEPRESVAKSLKRLSAQKRLLENGFPLPAKTSTPIAADARRSLYLLHNSLPYASGGYAVRAQGLAAGANRNNWNISCATRLGYPRDMGVVEKMTVPEHAVVDGVSYYRLSTPGNPYRDLDSEEYLARNSAAVEQLARKLRPAVIHGASNHINGIAANVAARKLGLKSVYEVRGLWELTRMSREPIYENSDHYTMAARMERDAAENADAVIAITHGLKRIMVERGVDESRIVVIPNGVDTERFKPLQPDEQLRERLGFVDKTVIGFIGSMPDYEGLEYLVQAVRDLVDDGCENVHLLLVGDGDAFVRISEMVSSLELGSHVTLTGRVPHSEVESYYSIVDIAAFPRKRQLVCEIVSPLKPFEAMAMGKAVIASDVAAISEFVENGATGMLFAADNAQDLAAKLKQLVLDEELRKQLGSSAREWVVEHRDWRQLGRRVVELYESL